MDIGGIDITAMGTSAITLFALIFVLLFIGGIVILITLAITKGKKYDQYKVIIFDKVGANQEIQKVDKAGIFVDKKTGNKRLFLKKFNVGLEADDFPYKIGEKGEKTIYLIQTGLKNFRFMDIHIDYPITALIVGEEDVNWAINDYDRAVKIFAPKDTWKELLPYAMFAVSVFGIIILMMWFFKKFDVLKDVAAQLNMAAQAIAQAKAGTLVIGGG